MRLETTVKAEHTEIVSALSWSPDCQLFTCGDDKSIIKWAADGTSQSKITTNLGYYITAISWYPSSGKSVSDMFAVSCMDGTFRFISRSGREEKKFTAHEGAVIVIEWSHDGTALLTAGEDGDLKIWSRSGNLRSTLVSTGQPIYSASWGPDDDQVLIASGKTLTIKSIQVRKKNVQWNAHEGIVLCTDWNVANGLIVSGGEDCTYRVWDAFGRQLYSSRPMEHVITSVGWSPNGECFAVGSFNMLRLCDKTGWTHCRERLSSGSIMDIAWTSDGTQLAGASGSGAIVFAQIVDRKFEWKNIEAVVVEAKKLRVLDVATESVEEIYFARDRVVEVGIGFDHLIAATTSQCYVYNLSNLNTPIIFDVRAPSHFIHLCKAHFLTLDLISGLQVINYDGRVISSPKFQGLRSEYLTKDMVAISPDTIAVVDTTDPKIIQIIDAVNGRNLNKLTHSVEVSSLELNQHSLGPQERLLAFADKNRDLFIYSIMSSSASGGSTASINSQSLYKLHSHVESFAFNDETDVLVGFSDGRLNVWYSPSVALLDKDLIPLTTSSTDVAEYGRNAQIVAYTGNRISVRKVDGSFLYTATSVDIPLLYELIRAGKWDESIRLCRHQKNSVLWGTLAAAAMAKKHLDAAEIAVCELNEFAKVEYIQYIKAIPSEEGRTAEMTLFKRQPEEAERILLQANPPLIYRAIKMNLNLYRWSRALDIAVKFKTHVDTVIAYRQQYLEEFEKKENIQKFLQYNQTNVDWQAIKEKESQEVEAESRRGGYRK